MSTLLDLRRAGFSDEAIAAWYNKTKIDLTKAGFNKEEQSNYFGVPFESKVNIQSTANPVSSLPNR